MRRALVAALVLVVVSQATAVAAPRSADRPTPVFAYYYIWFTPSHAPSTVPTTGSVSWNRPKSDYPLLGRYSSDERQVMVRHIRWAKRAGIGGFIVSWKSTEVLNRRLERLIRVASRHDFKLMIIYQGLDVRREPLPVERVAADLDLFRERYGGQKVFDALDAPTVVWSGTWEFSREQVEAVTRTRRDDLLILASERDRQGYERLAGLVDGNAYYWSSVNPDTYPGYDRKLEEMGRRVHAYGGLWIAPAAPGFDARSVGGTTVVDRKGGGTFRRQLDAAAGSSPDAIGLISWNEFSEGTHIEPSEKYGARELEVLADVLDAEGPVVADLDSSEPAATDENHALALLGGLVVLLVGGAAIVRGRRRRVTAG
jgi:Glycosyl hydrolase family 99